MLTDTLYVVQVISGGPSERVGLAAGDRIIIMPGAGVTPENIAQLARITGAKEFHFTGRIPEPSPMQYRHEGVSMGGTVTIDEYAYLFTDPKKISGALQALASIDQH